MQELLKDNPRDVLLCLESPTMLNKRVQQLLDGRFDNMPHQPPATTGSLSEALGFSVNPGEIWPFSNEPSAINEISDSDDDGHSTQGASSIYSMKAATEQASNFSVASSYAESLITQTALQTDGEFADLASACNTRHVNRSGWISCSNVGAGVPNSGMLNLHWHDDDDILIETSSAPLSPPRTAPSQLLSLGAQGPPRASWRHFDDDSFHGQRSAIPQVTMGCVPLACGIGELRRAAEFAKPAVGSLHETSEVLLVQKIRPSSVAADMQPGAMLGCSARPELVSPRCMRFTRSNHTSVGDRLHDHIPQCSATPQSEVRSTPRKPDVAGWLKDTVYTCSRADLEQFDRPARGGA